MKIKGKSESIPPSASTGSNKKRTSEVQEGEKKQDTSLLKKNEFALILLGALLLTIIVFFFFFRSSAPKTEPVNAGASNISLADLEKRIENMEQAFQAQEKSALSETDKAEAKSLAVDPVEERLARLETAFSVKFDSLTERMEKIEKTTSLLTDKPVKPADVPKTPVPVKKAVKKEKAADMFHTVQKGETLYSISKKYNTSVENLRKLNNLSAKDNIYPGNNILVR